ncbi:hypothetical protein [Natranaeroarchaeum aerophilus]|uniref:Uncharacterized protein n=1 Tax=Natranaeroarchaeum aerophilus TaxID=2917711 RepID=A0AAE3FP21_9EURY|nr:hypothetical protein [Natranaeroarchaeum aerophilus]MCL9812510.1 hypothetical protein [Natranaeroarchaeum aerophilus]
MIRFFRTLVCVVALLALLTGSVAAQEAENSTEPEPDERVICLNDITCVTDVNHQPENDQVEVTIESDRPQTIAYSDLYGGGEEPDAGPSRVDSSSVEVDRGETVITIPATTYHGEAMVTVSSEYGQTVRIPLGEREAISAPGLPGQPNSYDPLVVGSTALFIVTTVVVTCAYWFRNSNGGVYRVF